LLKKFIPQSLYARNVITLMTGTALAQALPIAIIPMLTRMYGPQEFGLAAIYISCLSVLALIVTGRYELAITLPATDEEAAHIVTFTLKLSLIASVALYIPIFLFGVTIADWMGYSALAPWFYLLPVSVFSIASFNVFQYWCNRKSQYQTMSTNRIQNAAFSSGCNLLFGLTKISGGMILGPSIGQAIAAGLIGRRVWAQDFSLLDNTTKQGEKTVASRYVDHPIYIAPAQLLGVIAVQIPTFMIGSIYSLAILGFFSIAYRIVSLPSTLIANSIGEVYRQQISVAYSERGEFRSIFVSTLKKTSMLAVPPFAAAYFIAPLSFELIFGAQWRLAGDYAQILVVAAFFQFIFTPVDKGAVVVGATRYILAWQVMRLFLILLLFFASKNFVIDIMNILWLFVFINSIMYLIDGIVEYRLAGK
jgi:O-antigen/teichoic acid export membrane protein